MIFLCIIKEILYIVVNPGQTDREREREPAISLTVVEHIDSVAYCIFEGIVLVKLFIISLWHLLYFVLTGRHQRERESEGVS